MRPVLLLLILGLARLNGADPVLVPGSTSPDGKTALYYFHDPAKELNDGYQLLFGDAKSFLPFSGDLMPDVPRDLTNPDAMRKADAAILLGGIAAHYEAGRQHVLWDPAFTSDVAWSPDSQWVSIDGGAHKFWDAVVYHRWHGDFRPVPLPTAEFEKYFDQHKKNLIVPDQGALAGIRKISTRNYDYPGVCWLGNGRLAINAFPYLLRNADYNKLETKDLFFVLDAKLSPAVITGFCH
jgi:hypothetical protein